MKKWLLLLLILLCWVSGGLALFGRADSQGVAGRPEPNEVRRIVSLAPNLTEILFSLGLGEQVVGVSKYSDYPPAAAAKRQIGTFWQPNIEAVIAGRPDLVVTEGFRQQTNTARRLERIGYKCLTVSLRTVDELFEAIRAIGAATARQARATELADDLKSKLEELSALMQTEQRIKVLWLIDRDPMRVAGRDTFVNELIELAGGENAIGRTVHKYPPIGSEQVIACAPDIIIEPAMSREDLAGQQETAFAYWSRFKNVPAVANRRIYVISPDTVSRLGPRLPQGVETVARCLRPELFED